jgi:hypothetical protein
MHFSNAHQRVKPPPPLIENAGAGGKQTAGFMAQADITGCVTDQLIIVPGWPQKMLQVFERHMC